MSNKKKDKKKFTGKITTTRAIKIFEALGFKTAEKWNAAQLEKKIKNLPDLAEGTKLSPKMQKRVNVIVSALKKGREVTVFNAEDVTTDKARKKAVDDAAKREVKRKGEKKAETAKKEKRADKKVIETEKTKTQAKKAVTASDKKKKLGVIASILEFIQNGPISKKAILAKLKQRFPDRPEDGMVKTIQAQLPNRLAKEKGIKIKVDDKGCFSIKK